MMSQAKKLLLMHKLLVTLLLLKLRLLKLLPMLLLHNLQQPLLLL